MKKRVEEIHKEQEALEMELKSIQEKCKHKHVEKEFCSDTGNYDPRDNSYWTNFHCLDCDKMWNEEGSK